MSFSNIIGNAYKKLLEASIAVEAEHTGSGVHGKVLHMRTGLITIADESTKNCYNIPWKDTNLSYDEINTVVLVYYVYKGIESHHQYVRHFYLDRNQTCG